MEGVQVEHHLGAGQPGAQRRAPRLAVAAQVDRLQPREVPAAPHGGHALRPQLAGGPYERVVEGGHADDLAPAPLLALVGHHRLELHAARLPLGGALQAEEGAVGLHEERLPRPLGGGDDAVGVERIGGGLVLLGAQRPGRPQARHHRRRAHGRPAPGQQRGGAGVGGHGAGGHEERRRARRDAGAPRQVERVVEQVDGPFLASVAAPGERDVAHLGGQRPLPPVAHPQPRRAPGRQLRVPGLQRPPHGLGHHRVAGRYGRVLEGGEVGGAPGARQEDLRHRGHRGLPQAAIIVHEVPFLSFILGRTKG